MGMISGILEALDHLCVEGLQLSSEGILIHDQALLGAKIIPEPDGIHPLGDIPGKKGNIEEP